MITSESVSRTHVWETSSRDRGLFITGFISALAVLITKQEGNAEFSKYFELEKPFFQSHFQGQGFVERILGNADLGKRDGREGVIMQLVMLVVTFPTCTTCKPGLPFMYILGSLVIMLSQARSRVLGALCLVYCRFSLLCFSSHPIFPFYPWDWHGRF